MRVIRKSSARQACTPNIIPCRIQHSGPVDASRRFWSPVSGEKGTKTVYFRGRKLYGRAVKLPKRYKGVVLVGSEKVLEREGEGKKSMEVEEEEEGEDEEDGEVKVMEEVGIFNEVLIWGHETVVDAEDTYVRSLEEWIGVAESVNSYAGDTNEGKNMEGETK